MQPWRLLWFDVESINFTTATDSSCARRSLWFDVNFS